MAFAMEWIYGYRAQGGASTSETLANRTMISIRIGSPKRNRSKKRRNTMMRIVTLLLATICFATTTDLFAQSSRSSQAARTPVYFPERFEWQHKRPAEVGMNSALVDEAVKAAIAAESKGSKVMQNYLAE